MGSNGDQTNNYYLGSIKNQEDHKPDNQNSNINNHIRNAWYKGCHSGYWGNIGQNCCNMYNLQQWARNGKLPQTTVHINSFREESCTY